MPKSFDKTILRGTLSAFLTNGLGIIAALCLQVLLARSMSIASFGLYSYVMSWVSVFVVLATLGSELGLLRFAPALAAKAQWDGVRGILRQSLRYTLAGASCLSLFVGATGYLGLWGQSGETRLCFAAAAVFLLIWALNNVRQASLRAWKAIFYSRFPDVVFRPLVFGALILIWTKGMGGELYAPSAYALHAAAALSAFALGGFFLKRASPLQVYQSTGSVRDGAWIKVSLSLMLSNLTLLGLAESDRIILGLTRGDEAVALYAAASRLALLSGFLMEAIAAIAAPQIAEVHASMAKTDLQALISKLSFYAGAATIPIVLAIVLLGRAVLSLFGPAFEAAYPLLVILCIGQLSYAFSGPASLALSMTGHERRALELNVAALGAQLVLNTSLTVLFGPVGAAGATAAALFFRNELFRRACRRDMGLETGFFSGMTKPALSNRI